MKTELQKLFENQITEEFFSAYLYLDLATQMDAIDYDGISHWFVEQAKEEISHAMYLRTHLLNRGVKFKHLMIDQPKTSFKTPLEAFEEALKHEKHITRNINKMATQAMAEGDHAAYSFLLWFVDEQIEEEDKFSTIVGKFEKAGDSQPALMELDAQLGARIFVDETPQL